MIKRNKKQCFYDEVHKKREHLKKITLPTKKLRQEIIFEIIAKQAKNRFERALDAGCGDGVYTIRLLQGGGKVDAVDVSELAIRLTENRITNPSQKKRLNLFTQNILEFKSTDKYDIIVCSEVLEHVEDDFSLIEKLSDYLKNSGKIVFSVPFNKFLCSKIDDDAGHVRRYDKQRIDALIEHAHLTIDQRIYYGFPILFLYWLFNRITNGCFHRRTQKSLIEGGWGLHVGILTRILDALLFMDRKITNVPLCIGCIVVAHRRPGV